MFFGDEIPEEDRIIELIERQFERYKREGRILGEGGVALNTFVNEISTDPKEKPKIRAILATRWERYCEESRQSFIRRTLEERRRLIKCEKCGRNVGDNYNVYDGKKLCPYCFEVVKYHERVGVKPKEEKVEAKPEEVIDLQKLVEEEVSRLTEKEVKEEVEKVGIKEAEEEVLSKILGEKEKEVKVVEESLKERKIEKKKPTFEATLKEVINKLQMNIKRIISNLSDILPKAKRPPQSKKREDIKNLIEEEIKKLKSQ